MTIDDGSCYYPNSNNGDLGIGFQSPCSWYDTEFLPNTCGGPSPNLLYRDCDGNCINDNDGDGICNEEETEGDFDLEEEDEVTRTSSYVRAVKFVNTSEHPLRGTWNWLALMGTPYYEVMCTHEQCKMNNQWTNDTFFTKILQSHEYAYPVDPYTDDPMGENNLFRMFAKDTRLPGLYELSGYDKFGNPRSTSSQSGDYFNWIWREHKISAIEEHLEITSKPVLSWR